MPRAAGFRWAAFARSVIDAYGGLCHVCGLGHGGARQADHLDPQTENPAQPFDLARFRPAHGAPGNPCESCSREAGGKKIYCNQIRNMGSTERARRIIAGYKEAAKRGEAPVPRTTGYTAGKSPPESGITGEPGRDW